MKAILLTVLAALALAGCREVEVPNGEIPTQYMGAAQKYMGTYQRTDRGGMGELTIEMRGQKVVAMYRGNPNDLIGAGCGSQIGLLKTITVDEKGSEYILKGAKFAFDPGACTEVQGRQLHLSFREKRGQILMSGDILENTQFRQECRVEVDPWGRSRTVCEQVPYQNYFEYDFVK